MHGLRKGCLRILAEAGCNILELQSRSGHLTLYAFRAAKIHRQGRQTFCRRSRGREGHRAHDKAKNRAENRGLNVYPSSNVCLTVRKLLKLLVLAIPAGKLEAKNVNSLERLTALKAYSVLLGPL